MSIIIEHKGRKDLLNVLYQCINVDIDDVIPLLAIGKKGTFQQIAKDYAVIQSKILTQDKKEQLEIYNSTIGDIIEAFFEAYAKLFLVNGNSLTCIYHTSYDKYYVAFDLIGFRRGDIPVKFQVKYRTQQKGKEHRWKYEELKTFFTRADDEKISRDNLFLVDFSSSLVEAKSHDVFCFSDLEKQKMMQNRCRVITGEMMANQIRKDYQHDQNKKQPLTEFYEHVIELIENSIKCEVCNSF